MDTVFLIISKPLYTACVAISSAIFSRISTQI